MRKFYPGLFYAYQFLGGCLPIYAFQTPLFLERGMSVGGVALLIALWSAFAIAFELPSGVLADRWNRRYMLSLSVVLRGLCFVLWYFAHSFPLFALGFLFWAVSGAFASGTEESLLYDNLKSDGRENDFPKVYGRARFFDAAGNLIGIAGAGALAGFLSVGAMSLFSAMLCFLNGLVALLLRERNYYAERQREKQDGFFGTLREAGAFLRGNRAVLAFVLFMVLFSSLGSYLDEFDALIVDDLGLGKLWVSGIMTVRFLFVALGNLIAPVLGKGLASPRRLFLLNGLASGVLGVFALLWHRYAIPLFGLSFLFMAVTEVLLQNAVQGEIREEGRATVASFYGVLQNGMMIVFCLVYALLAGSFPLRQVYLILAAYGVIGGAVFFFSRRL